MSSIADFREVTLGLPERLALGAATGTPDSAQSLRATGFDGTLTATVGSPAETVSGILLFFGITQVSGPGRNFSASLK
jgi:hypothetical protein